MHVQKRTQVSVYRITENGPHGFGWGQAGYFKVGAFLHMWHLRTLSTITYYSLLHTFGMLLSLHMRPLHSLLSYRLLLGTVLYALPTLHVCALGVAGGI